MKAFLQALWRVALLTLKMRICEEHMSFAVCVQQPGRLQPGQKHAHACIMKIRTFGDSGRLAQC